MTSKGPRPYETIARRVAEAIESGTTRERRMEIAVDALWEGLRDRGVSWVGFYLKSPDADEMLLGPHRDKPACSPVGLHGACGRCWRERRPLVVRDVRDLGENYVACDPRDRSEIVLPCLDPDGTAWGVLDLDSFDVASFNHTDVPGLRSVLNAAFDEGRTAEQ
jgi:putative methionine-R-sulfoxide reductase with GAF domain